MLAATHRSTQHLTTLAVTAPQALVSDLWSSGLLSQWAPVTTAEQHKLFGLFQTCRCCLHQCACIDWGCAHAVVNGEQSQLLGQIHIALLRLLQMDLEEAHATGAIQVSLVGLPQIAPYILLLTHHSNSRQFVF